jgi:hypothetical protein
MRLVSSRRAIANRQLVEDACAFVVLEVMPEGRDILSLIDESVERIDLGFQEKFDATRAEHAHQDVVLSGWSGSWGKFCTLMLDRNFAKLKVWADTYIEVDVNRLDTREGKASLGAAVENAILNREKHAYVVATEYERLPAVGFCRHNAVLTVVYQLQRTNTIQSSLAHRIDKFLAQTVWSRKTLPG